MDIACFVAGFFIGLALGILIDYVARKQRDDRVKELQNTIYNMQYKFYG